jgi:hypothetical protein
MSIKFNFVVDRINTMDSWNGNFNPTYGGGGITSYQAGTFAATDPIRRDHGSLWLYDAETQRLVFGREKPEITSTSIIRHVLAQPPEYQPYSPTMPTTPFGRLRQRIAIIGNPDLIASNADWQNYVLQNYYGRLAGESGNQFKQFVDHAFIYDSPYTQLEELRLGLQGTAEVASTKFDYNYYYRKYESTLNQSPPGFSTLYPHIYSLYYEKERGLGLPGDTRVSLLDPTVDNPSYDEDFIYNDFVTLNRNLSRVFIDTIRFDPTSYGGTGREEKSGERDVGKYFDEWSNFFALYLNGSAGSSTNNALAVIRNKYKNIILSKGSTSEYQTFFKFKELYPMFAEISFPALDSPAASTPRGTMPIPFSEGLQYAPLPLNVIQNVWHESRNYGGGPTPTNYTFSLRTGEEHQAFDLVSATSPNIRTERKIFDLTSFTIDCRDDEFTVEPKGDPNSYVLFKRVEEARGPVYDPSTGLRTVSDDPTDEESDTLYTISDGLLEVTEYLINTITQTVQNSLRSYSDILSGSTSAAKSAFFVVNKYEYNFENEARGDLVQTYVMPESKMGMPKIFNLADTQLEYDRSYEYEVLQNTIVVGSNIKIKNLFLPRGSTTGDPGGLGALDGPASISLNSLGALTPGGRTLAEMDILDEDPSTSLTGDTAPTFTGETYPSRFTLYTAYTAEMDIQIEPSVQIIEMPYAVHKPSWSPTDGSFGVGTILDNPSVAPDINIIPYRGINDRLLFNFTSGIGSKRGLISALNENDEEYLNKLRAMNIDPDDASIIFENDDPSSVFQIYRLDRKPKSYEDFKNRQLVSIDTSRPETGFRRTSAASYVDSIEPNKKYYYVFASVDFHGHTSKPTEVYEVELVDNDGAVFPVIRLVPFQTIADFKSSDKKMRRFLQVNPQLMQTIFNENETGITRTGDTDGSPTTAPYGDSVSLGFQDERLWSRTFKVRLTSRQTGKKIDFNIRMKKEYDDTRPTNIDYELPAEGTTINLDGPGNGGGTGGSGAGLPPAGGPSGGGPYIATGPGTAAGPYSDDPPPSHGPSGPPGGGTPGLGLGPLGLPGDGEYESPRGDEPVPGAGPGRRQRRDDSSVEEGETEPV